MALTVLMLVNQMNIGGTETHILSLAKQLTNEGVNVIIGTAGGVLLDAVTDSQSEIVQLPFKAMIRRFEYRVLLEKNKELVQTKT